MAWETIGLTDPLSKGQHVKDAQAILHNSKYGPFLASDQMDGIYGNVTAAAVKHAKQMIGYPLRAVNTSFGQRLHDYLTQGTPLSDPMKERRATRLKAHDDHPSVRDNMVKWCRWGVEHEPSIHYAPIRPIRFPAQGTLPLTTDCSGSTIIFARWAGVPPHPGLEYNGAGSSMDMGSRLRHISKSAALPGDLACWPGHHVCVVVEPGADPLLESHGMERGPLLVRTSDEASFHGGQPVFLSLL